MGVYANTVSITQFAVTGELPGTDQLEWISKKLSDRGFQSIENSTEIFLTAVSAAQPPLA